MKHNPNDYAEMLIEKYMQLKQKETLGWSGMSAKMSIQCAINDVNNTIEAFRERHDSVFTRSSYYDTISGKYYTEVLNILKSKL